MKMEKVLQIARGTDLSLLPAVGEGGTSSHPLSPIGSPGGCRLADPREISFLPDAIARSQKVRIRRAKRIK